MSDAFIPLMAAPLASGQTALFQLKVLPQAETQSVLESLPDGASGQPAAQPCGRPSLTLRRQGEEVCGIRIECACGQVIELECVY
jgi:hypothetical protein